MHPAPTDLPVFVYGTLRRTEGNYRLLSGKTSNEADAVLYGATMYGAGCPFVRRTEDPSQIVVGEIMWLDPVSAEETMRRLDRLEGFRGHDNPGNMYDRVQATVQTNEGLSVEVWVYVASARHSTWLAEEQRVFSGDWVAHVNDRVDA